MKIVNDKKEDNEMVYCNKCETEIIPVNGKCPVCGLNFNPNLKDLQSVSNENKASDDEHYVHGERIVNTGIYKRIAILILIFGFIGGICAGNAYAICSDYSTGCIEKEFNGDIMIYCWIGTILFDIFVFGIHSICYRLDLLIDKIK